MKKYFNLRIEMTYLRKQSFPEWNGQENTEFSSKQEKIQEISTIISKCAQIDCF